MISKNRLKSRAVIHFSVIAAGLIFLLWRAKYGWCWDDEPFILSLAQRLYYGHSLITDEWHVSQFTGVVLLPFYKLFRLFSDSNEGLLITFRYIYCFLWFAVCVCVYRVIAKKYKEAIWVYIYLILFSPLDYMTMSYTSLGLMSSLLLCSLYYRHFEIEPVKPIPLGVLSALLWSVVVLNCPYMVVAYVLAFAGALIAVGIKKRRGEEYFDFLRSRIVELALVAILAAIVVYFFILRGNSLKEILFGLECISGDPQHFPVDYIGRLIGSIAEYDIRSRLLWIPTAIVICFSPFIVKRRWLRLVSYAILSLAYAAVVRYYVVNWSWRGWLNAQIQDIVILGLGAYALLKNKPKKMFLCFVPFSFLYGIASVLGSNTQGKALAMCMAVAGVAGVIFIICLGAELKDEFAEERVRLVKALPVLITAAVMLTQFTCSLHIRLIRQYTGLNMDMLTERVECGAAKGLYVEKEKKEEYEKIYSELETLLAAADADASRDGFLTTDFYPVLYLDVNMPTAAFSSWNYGYGSELDERLDLYYSYKPDMKPTVIFFSGEPDESLAEKWLGEYEIYTAGGSTLYKAYVKN